MGKRSKKRPYAAGHRPLQMDRLSSLPRTETGPGGGSFTVRRVNSGAKEYICPGCLQTIYPHQAHMVVWPNDGFFGPEADLAARRHWHSPCWQRRLRPQ